MSYGKTRSNWWFLLPILFGIIGGIIAYFVLRSDDPKKAKNCILLAIALFVIGIGIQFALFGTTIPLDEEFNINV